MVTRSATPKSDMAHALTVGQSCHNRDDHCDLRKGEWVMGRRADGVGKKQK